MVRLVLGVLTTMALAIMIMIVPARSATIEEMQLLDAARSCDNVTTLELLNRGVSIEARSTGGHTPLINAAFGECLQTVQLLLQLGADRDAVDDSGYTAADLARLYGYEDIEYALTGTVASTQDAAADIDTVSAPTCPYVNDGECDEPEIGTGLCEPNTDVDDCQAISEFFSSGQNTSAWEAATSETPKTCEQMYTSCQSTCGYFTGNFQWVTDYSCMTQCSMCHESCVNGHVTACTNEFRPWGGQ